MRTMHRLALIAAISTCVTFPAAANVIADWNEKTVEFVIDTKMPPPQAERVMTMVHVAMFDAVNTIDRRYRPYLVQPAVSATASMEAAAAVAAERVLLGLRLQAEKEIQSALTTYLDAIPDGPAKAEGGRHR
jgi:hypothetical protein